MSVRDPRDMATSAIKKKMIRNNETEILKFLDDVINVHYKAWEPYIDLELKYEVSINKNDRKTIEQIHQLLELPPEGVGSVLESLQETVPSEQYDRTTLLWPNHLNGGFERF